MQGDKIVGAYVATYDFWIGTGRIARVMARVYDRGDDYAAVLTENVFGCGHLVGIADEEQEAVANLRRQCWQVAGTPKGCEE